MSFQVQKVCERQGCDTRDTKGNFHHGKYCSNFCEYADQGGDIIKTIEHDHRFCASCFRVRKEVFRPSEHPEFRKKAKLIRDSFVGYEYTTENVERGDFGLECRCGNIDHFHADEYLRNTEAYSWLLKLLFEYLNDIGVVEETFDLEAFLDGYWNENSMEYAIGVALYE